MEPSGHYKVDGKTYKKRTCDDVNASHALEDIQAYVEGLPPDAVIYPHGPEKEVPFESISDYVCTLRRACAPDSPFEWPNESMLFEKAIAVAAHHLPPGFAMCIQNKLPIPSSITGQQQPPQKPMASGASGSGTGGGLQSDAARGEASTSWSTMASPSREADEGTYASYGGTGSKERYRAGVPRVASAFERSEPVSGMNRHHFVWDEGKRGDDGLPSEVSVYYHGTSAHDLPYIMAEGFRPSIGAGADHVVRHYGLTVPGVYVSPSWRLCIYPYGRRRAQ